MVGIITLEVRSQACAHPLKLGLCYSVSSHLGRGTNPVHLPCQDVLEELLQQEIVDETDKYVDVHRHVLVSRIRKASSRADTGTGSRSYSYQVPDYKSINTSAQGTPKHARHARLKRGQTVGSQDGRGEQQSLLSAEDVRYA